MSLYTTFEEWWATDPVGADGTLDKESAEIAFNAGCAVYDRLVTAALAEYEQRGPENDAEYTQPFGPILKDLGELEDK